jgi:hypothetical protein
VLAIISFLGGTSGLRKRQLRELLRSVDELAAMPDLSIAEHGVEGAKGSISMIDRGFILHSYFSGPGVRFEIYGPFAPGTERSPRPAQECSGLTGSERGSGTGSSLAGWADPQAKTGEPILPATKRGCRTVWGVSDVTVLRLLSRFLEAVGQNVLEVRKGPLSDRVGDRRKRSRKSSMAPFCFRSGESRDQAGTYVNLITSSPTRSLVTRRSGGRGPEKNGLPRPSTMGWR